MLTESSLFCIFYTKVQSSLKTEYQPNNKEGMAMIKIKRDDKVVVSGHASINPIPRIIVLGRHPAAIAGKTFTI